MQCRAVERQRLPRLPTTALHGALGHVLKHLAPGLASTEAQGGGEGVTNYAPTSLVLRPGAFEAEGDCLRLEAGAALEFELVLIGKDAMSQVAAACAAAGVALERGLALPGKGPRPALKLEEVRWSEDGPLRPVPEQARVTWLSPARLTSSGRPAEEFDEALLWRSMRRRAETLCAAYGGVMPSLEEAPGFDIDDGASWIVDVGRYSTRQAQHMKWPGLVGWLDLRVKSDAAARLLAFSERVGLGKGTSFGCGQFKTERWG